MTQGAVISGILGTPTHDGEGWFVIELMFPGGGRSKLQMTGAEAARVVARAGTTTIDELIGKPWTVLQIRPAEFMSPDRT